MPKHDDLLSLPSDSEDSDGPGAGAERATKPGRTDRAQDGDTGAARRARRPAGATGGRQGGGGKNAGGGSVASLLPVSSRGDIQVPLFEPGKVLLGPHRVQFIGATGSGKSSIIMRFLYEIRQHIPVMIVWCGSEGETNQYGPHVPPLYIHSKLRRENLKSYLQQRKLAKLYSSNPTCLAVFDDVFEKPTDFNNRVIRALYKQGRGLFAATWVATQYVMDMPPWARFNTSIAVLMRVTNQDVKKKLYQNFGGNFASQAEFTQYYDAICGGDSGQYRAMVVPCGAVPGLTAKCYWYAVTTEWAKKTPDFRMCHPAVWEECDRRMDKKKAMMRNLDDVTSSDEN